MIIAILSVLVAVLFVLAMVQHIYIVTRVIKHDKGTDA